MWFDKDGVLYSVSKKVPPQTVDAARETLAQFKQIVGDRKLCMILDLTNASPSDRETREFAAVELTRIVKAMGMVSGSPLGRMIANLFFGLKPPPYPVKMFADEKEAKAWIRQYL
jgi:mRNA degradation ribonuclease J1/J2